MNDTGTVSASGFLHGPASNTSSTVNTRGGPAGHAHADRDESWLPGETYHALIGVLKVRFIPEPGLLLLTAGGAGLAPLGRGRMKL